MIIMTVLNFLGFFFILLIAFVIGLIIGNWTKTKGIEDAGYKIHYTPNAKRKYHIIDMSNYPTGYDPTIGSYEDLFKK